MYKSIVVRSYNGPVAMSGNGNGNARGRGEIPGGIASALQAVKGIAGKKTRMQLEKTVVTELL